jgi:hypothetical protein
LRNSILEKLPSLCKKLIKISDKAVQRLALDQTESDLPQLRREVERLSTNTIPESDDV